VKRTLECSLENTRADSGCAPGKAADEVKRVQWIAGQWRTGRGRRILFSRTGWALLLLVFLPFGRASAGPVTDARELAAQERIEDAYALLERALLAERDEAKQHRLISCMSEISLKNGEALTGFINHAAVVDTALAGENKAYLRYQLGLRYQLVRDFENSTRVLAESLDVAPESAWTWRMKKQLCVNDYLQERYAEALAGLDALRAAGNCPSSGSAESLCVQMVTTLAKLEDWHRLIEEAESFAWDVQEDARKLGMLDWLAVAYKNVLNPENEERVLTELIEIHERLYPVPTDLQKARRESWQRRLSLIPYIDPLVSGPIAAELDKGEVIARDAMLEGLAEADPAEAESQENGDADAPLPKAAAPAQEPAKGPSRGGFYAGACAFALLVCAIAVVWAAGLRRARRNADNCER